MSRAVFPERGTTQTVTISELFVGCRHLRRRNCYPHSLLCIYAVGRNRPATSRAPAVRIAADDVRKPAPLFRSVRLSRGTLTRNPTIKHLLLDFLADAVAADAATADADECVGWRKGLLGFSTRRPVGKFSIVMWRWRIVVVRFSLSSSAAFCKQSRPDWTVAVPDDESNVVFIIE